MSNGDNITAGSAPAASHISKDVRTLLIGVACIGTILLVGKVIPQMVATRRATESQLRLMRTELAQDRQIISHRKSTIKSLDETTTKFLGYSSAFLKGSSASQAAAALASVVADAADANGVHLSSVQPEADSANHTLLVPVVVHASGTGDVRGVAGMLRDLEGGEPLTEIRQLTMAQSDPAAPADRMESLHIELTIRGLYRRIPDSPDDKVGQ
jgi:hypothetical protein